MLKAYLAINCQDFSVKNNITKIMKHQKQNVRAGSNLNADFGNGKNLNYFNSIMPHLTQLCDDSTNNNSLSVNCQENLEGVVATPSSSRSAIMIVPKEYNELPSLAMEMCR